MTTVPILDDLTQFIPGFLYVYEETPDGGTRFSFASNGISEIYGISAEEAARDAGGCWRTIHPDDFPHVAAAVSDSKRTLEDWECEYRVVHPEKGLIWVHGRARPTRCASGETRWVGVIQDVTARRIAQDQAERHRAALQAESTRIDRLFELSVDLIGYASEDGRFLRLSRSWEMALGWPLETLMASPFLEFVHPEDQEATTAALARLGRGKAVIDFVNRYRTADGGWRALEWRSSPVEGGVVYFVARDVTEKRLLEESLREAKRCAEERARALQESQRALAYSALHDPLTGLPNRRYLERAIADLAAETARPGRYRAALHVDLDHFKQINDGCGHAVGDAVLKEIAALLRKACRESDFVARVGGDEFVILCRDAAGPVDVAALAQRLVKTLARSMTAEGRCFRVSASIGAAAQIASEGRPEQLLLNADIALYRAKRAGRCRFAWFSRELRSEISRRKTLSDELERALECDEITPFYQPQIRAADGAVGGLEALVRWRHPEHGLLTPDRFLDVAEESGLVAALDRRVLEQAVADRAALAAAGLGELRISVNVSARRLAEGDLADQIEALAPPSGALSVELVESVFLDDAGPEAAATIARLKELGVPIEIDDFGTGHASLVALLKLNPTRLKIDRQFVMPMFERSECASLAAAMAGIGRSLGVEVVAEGVESQAHVNALAAMGCDLLQGYHFAKPMPFADLKRYLAAAAARAA